MPARKIRTCCPEHVVYDALKQAMIEYGVADHLDGKCPSLDCRCKELADDVDIRTRELAGDALGLGRSL